MNELHEKALKKFNKLLRKLETCEDHERARYEKRLEQAKDDLEDLEVFMYASNEGII